MTKTRYLSLTVFFVQGGMPALQEILKILAAQFAIAEYLGQETRAENLTRVNGHDGDPAVGVPKEVVAAFDSDDLKSAGL